MSDVERRTTAQLRLVASPEEVPTGAAPETIVALEQLRSGQSESSPEDRIRQLERALDIALESLSAWKSQGRNWDELGKRLANSEETNQIQHLAIVKLKEHLRERERSLSSRIAALDRQWRDKSMSEARWQQGYRELQIQHDRARQRIAELENRLADLQEHLLHQDRQVKEYETAIKHWQEKVHYEPKHLDRQSIPTQPPKPAPSATINLPSFVRRSQQ